MMTAERRTWTFGGPGRGRTRRLASARERIGAARKANEAAIKLAVISTIALVVVSGFAIAAAAPAGPGDADERLISHWTFDDGGAVGKDAGPSRNDAVMEGGLNCGITGGVHGGAMSFAGSHQLGTAGLAAFDKLRRVSLSAWVMPTGFTVYNEIFRKEDGNRRVLFSFQGNGGILSLGLNVGGYVECDARINPRQLLDGAWHHCAATFDGKVMRVYLDGREIGSLAREGDISAGGAAAGCIGSSNGAECFQGCMDDLRIYREAISAQEVTGLYRAGLESLRKYYAAHEEQLKEVYPSGRTFAETIAALRKALSDRPTAPALSQAIAQRLQVDFPDQCREFAAFSGATAATYVTSPQPDLGAKLAARAVELLLEYRPLTENQWARQTPEQLAHWKKLDPIEQRYRRLVAAGAAARHSPGWIDLVLEAGPLIQHRPSTSEAVAPYVTPATPETRDLTADEASRAQQADWLHQAGNDPSPRRIADEILWARKLADRIRSDAAPAPPDFTRELAELDDLDRQAATLKGPDRELYFRVRQVKRSIHFRSPAVNFDKMLFVDMPLPAGKEWPHETRHRLGYMAVPGARLLVLEGLSPAGKLRQLMPQPPLHGSFWRPDVSWDGQSVLFCFKPHNEKSFHLYRINADGTGMTQLTDGPYDDLDPIWLPDGHIMFSTTRGHTYVRCMPPTNAYPLARCDGDGRNVYIISANNEPDYLPSVLDDGRVIYTRWEYTDKPLWRAMGLWTVNPDGTQVNTLWGNQSVWPDLLKDARGIPGSRRVMFTGSAHHNWFGGSVGIIDPDRGFNFPEGLTKVTADTPWPECGNGPVDPVESPNYHTSGHYTAYYSPYPLSEKDFLVSANRGGKFVLYLMDVDGNRELIYEGVNNIFHAMPLRARHRPAVMPDKVDWPTVAERLKPKGGVIYSPNVYMGAPPELAGKARFLRVLTIEHKTYTYWYKRPYLSTGPVVSGVQSEGVKRVLGTVPIQPDGSVAFNAPSGTPLHFQLLDERYRALHTMRSFAGLMPGEVRGCQGCHELHSTTPANGGLYAAIRRTPSDITPPPWGQDTVSYARYVRPVLDRYCAKCHEGDGKGRSKVDFTPRPGFLGFDETYWLFTGRPAWGKAYAMPKDPPPGFGIADMIMVEGFDTRDPVAYQTTKPMTKLSYRSRLIERASSGEHHGMKVDEISLRKLIAWVDAMCPYLGDEEVRQIDDPVFQGVGWLAIPPKVRTAPRIVRPGPVD